MGWTHCKIEKFGNREFLWWFASNSRFIAGNHDRKFKHWANKGITAICTMVKDENMLGFERLKEKFELGEHEEF